MRRLVRKLIMLTLALVMIAAMPGAAIAATATSPAVRDVPTAASGEGGMETALIAVKGIISVDEEVYTDFSYSSTFSNQQTREGLVWNFNWSGGDKGSIYASATADGTLLQYRRYEYNSRYFGFADVSRDKASATALVFLKKASPDLSAYYSQDGEPEIRITDSEYSFAYTAKVSGHSFDAAFATVSVNKFTGEITSYYTSNLNPEGYTFEDAAKLITTDAAIAAYADKLGLSLEYRSYYDYAANKPTVFPVYMARESSDKFISAVTGEVVAYVYDRVAENGGTGMDGAAPEASTAQAESTAGSARLSPQELEAIKKAQSFISGEEALKKLLTVMELSDIDTAAFAESYISLDRDYINRDKYIYNVSMYSNDPGTMKDNIYHLNGRVDAATGRVLSFSYYSDAEAVDASKLITEAQATATVEKFLNANTPNELKKSKLDSVQAPVADKYYSNQSFNFSYYRTENGAPFRNNGIRVTLDARTGKITGYALEWYENVAFPSVASVLTPQTALTEYVALSGAQTNYITVGGGKASLVYDFGVSGYIDPFTGKPISHRGDKDSADVLKPDYSDLKGHWSEKYVNRLLENGVYSWGGKFEPERVMTQLEFLQYLMTLEPWYQVEPLQYFKDNGIKADIKADDKTPVTRQEAARIIAEYMGYGKLAEKYKWFAYPFDGAVDEAYKGYITVCCALGIINGTGGEYNAKATVTRAEAAALLHNLIVAKSEG